MFQRFSTMICCAALTVVMGATVQAATLEIIQAPVRANFGQGFVPVGTGTQLNPGDQAMAKPGGRGQIVYDDGCTDPVEEGKVVVVQDQSPCVGAASWWGGAKHVGLMDYAIYTIPGAAVIGGLIFLFQDDDSGLNVIDVGASP